MFSFDILPLPTNIYVIIECTQDDCDNTRERPLYAVTSEEAAQQAIVYEDTRNKQLVVHEAALSKIWKGFFDVNAYTPVAAHMSRKPRVLDFDTSGNYDEYEKAVELWKKELRDLENEFKTEYMERSAKGSAAIMEYAQAHNLDGGDLDKLGVINGQFYGLVYNLERTFRYEELQLKAV